MGLPVVDLANFDLARDLPLAGSFCYDYGAPQINRMIADGILTGDRLVLSNRCMRSLKKVYDLEFYADMDEFEEDIQIDECLDYIESLEEKENFDPVIESALLQFEEDFDYEKSLYEENKASEKQQINLHRLLSCEPEHRPHWAGYASCEYCDDVRLDSGSQNGPFQTDRFTLDPGDDNRLSRRQIWGLCSRQDTIRSSLLSIQVQRICRNFQGQSSWTKSPYRLVFGYSCSS